MDRSGWIIVGSLIIGMLIFGYILGDISLQETVGLLENVQLDYVFIYLVASVGRQVFFTLMWSIILRAQKEKVPFINLLNYRIADYTISFLTPGPKVGGELTRASMLEKHGIRLSKGMSSSVIDKMMEIFGNALFLMIGVIIITVLIPVPLGWKITLYAVSTIFLVMMIAFFASMSLEKSLFHALFRIFGLTKTKLAKWEKSIIMFENHLHRFYTKERSYFFLALLSTMPAWILSLIEIKYLLLMLGMDATWAQVFLIGHVMGAVYLIPVPLALGTLEASQISLFAIFGRDTKIGVLVAFLTRIRDLLFSAWGLAVLGYYGLNLRDAIEKYLKKGLDWFNGD